MAAKAATSTTRSHSPRSPRAKAAVGFVFASVSTLGVVLGACKSPPPAPAAVVDSGPPPAATDAAPAQLVPMDFDAGSAIDAAPTPAKHGGHAGLTTNQARAKQCCNALRAQAKSLGASPEANILTGFAAQCDGVAMQMGPTSGGQAPEFAALRSLLQGHNMPSVCSGL